MSDLTKKSLKALRRIRDEQRLSFKTLCITIAVLREAHTPYIPPDDTESMAVWFIGLGKEAQTRMIDDAMGVTALRREGFKT